MKDDIAAVEVEEVGEVTPHNLAIYETGKELIGQSLKVGRDYCKFMITTSLSAIPIFLSIIAFSIPNQAVLDSTIRISLLIPVVLFMAAALIFTAGYFPVAEKFSLDVVEEIEAVHTKTIRRRSILLRIGVALFVIAVVIACILVVITMR